jgi:phosphate transport system substrate-binding protein
MRSRSRASFLLLVALALAGVLGCAPSQSRRAITIKGSDTMVILTQRWAETYMAAHPGTVIQVTGGGSGTGIAALINGTTDICDASRPMKDSEKQQVQQRYGSPPVEIVVAKDGLSLYVNEANPVHEIAMAQLKDVYTGKAKDWKAVGGQAGPITLYGRENSSGTYEFFKEHVLGGDDFAASTQTLPGTAAVVNAVAKDKNGIGYGGAAYAKGVRDLAVSSGGPATLPTQDNVKSGAYPLSRNLYFYLRKPPEGAMADFVAFVQSDSGQAIVSRVGYFPLR